MFMDMLLFFIALSIIFFILSIYLMEDKPFMSIPFIMIGMIFTILCTYGMWNIEVLYVNYNATSGITNTSIYSTIEYGEPYSYIFVLFFFIYCILFIKAGFNMWRDALKTEGELNYRTRDRRWR